MLDQKVANLVQGGIRYNTRRSYSAGQKLYLKFCNQYGLIPLPVTEDNILRFVAYMNGVPGRRDKNSLSAGTMNVYLASIRSMQVMSGMDTPSMFTPRVTLALRSVSSNQPPPSQRLPIKYDMLRYMLQCLDSDSDQFMWKAALCLGFYGCCRGSEYTQVSDFHTNIIIHPAPTIDSIQFITHEGNPCMIYSINRSKTTTYGLQKHIGCSHTEVCSVCSMKLYLNERYAVKPYTAKDRLFVTKTDSALTKQMLNQKLQTLAKQLGWDASRISSHSLRAGCASSCAGFKDWEIASLGNWRSTCYQSYIRNMSHHHYTYSSRIASNNT